MDIARHFSAFLDRRMIRIFLIGSISGFPALMIYTMLSLWLKESGFSRSDIGFIGLIGLAFAINFLWAPLIDRLPVPYLSKRFGRRRAWIVVCQLVIIASLLLWSMLDPSGGFAAATAVVTIAVSIAFASATQDIVIDAFRIEQMKEGDQSGIAAGAIVAVMGWFTGFKLGGLVFLGLADRFQSAGFANYWNLTFMVMAGTVAVMMLLALLVPESRPDGEKKKTRFDIVKWLEAAVVAPFTEFFKKNGVPIALAILGFIFLFKLGEAFLGRMSGIFYLEIGFSKWEIALYSKGLGWTINIIFSLVGGLIALWFGSVRSLFIAGIAMAATNLMFSLLAWVGPSEMLFALAVVLDEITAVISTIAFVIFISLMVDRRYTATQYALLASLGTAGRTILASISGLQVDWLGGDWGTFFVITALMVIPSLVILLWLAPRLKITSK